MLAEILKIIENSPATQLEAEYFKNYKHQTTLNEHLPILRKLSSECSTVMEIGVDQMRSGWGLLFGLSESRALKKKYIGVDIHWTYFNSLTKAKRIANALGIKFEFHLANSLDIIMQPVDMLFIDGLHMYAHVTYELETFSPFVKKTIALHDTSPPFELEDCPNYRGDYSEYPDWIDRSKRGVWTAVVDFLKAHPEWKLEARYYNQHGLTVLSRSN